MTLRQRIGLFIAGKPMAVVDNNGYRSTRFYGAKYEDGLPSPAPLLALDSGEIRRHVRRLSHESLQTRVLLERDVDTTIAQGLNLSAQPKYNLLGIDPSFAKEWASDVERRFELWAMSNRASRNGGYNFFQAQRLMRKYLYRDGELFIVLSYHNDPSLLSPLRFQIIDPDQVCENGIVWTGGNLLNLQNREGIIRNADGEETSYKIWNYDYRGIQTMTQIPRIGRGGRLMVIHAITGQDYAGQLRGVSPFAVCVQDLENILNFTLSEVEKAKNQSNIYATVESDSDQPAVDPFLKIKSPFGNGNASQIFGDKHPSGDEQGDNKDIEPMYTAVPHTEIKHIGGVGVFSLKGRQKLKPFPSTAPASEFNVFVDAYFAYIAAATGQSVETALMKFGQNYSASRATLDLTWRIAKQRRWELDYAVLGPLYESWLSEEIAAGRIQAPGFSDPRIRSAWTCHEFSGLPMPQLDPEKEIAAKKGAIEIGATSPRKAARDLNDGDFEANCAETAEDMPRLRDCYPMPWGVGNAKEESPKE